MKQTNNAIKFLMAQYRAIFNNAYFKGLATAALVTVAMSAGQAQAASGDLADFISGSSKDNVKGDFTTTTNDNESISGSAGGYLTNLTITKDKTLSFDGSTNANTGHIHVYETLTVQSGGTLTLKGTTSGTGNGWGVVGATNPSSEDLTDFKPTSKLFVDGGNVSIDKSQIQMASVVLNNATVTIKTNHGDSANPIADNAQINAVAVYDDAGNHVAGTGLFTVKGADSAITLDSGSILNAAEFSLEDGKITMKGGDADNGSGSVIRTYTNGGKVSGIINFQGTDVEVSGATTGNYIGGKVVNLKSGSTIELKDGAALHISGVLNAAKTVTEIANAPLAGTINLEGATVKVGSTGNLIVDHADSVFNATSGEIKNSGTITFKNKTVNSTSALFKQMVSGTVSFATAGSVLTITDDKVDLTSAGTGLLKNDGTYKDNFTAANGLTLKNNEVTLGSKFAVNKFTVETGVLKLTPSSNDDKNFTQTSGSLIALNGLTSANETTLKEVIVSGGTSKSDLTLGQAGTTNGQVTKVRKANSKGEAAGSEGTLNIYGKWNLTGTELNVGASGAANLANAANVTIKNLTVAATMVL